MPPNFGEKKKNRDQIFIKTLFFTTKNFFSKKKFLVIKNSVFSKIWSLFFFFRQNLGTLKKNFPKVSIFLFVSYVSVKKTTSTNLVTFSNTSRLQNSLFPPLVTKNLDEFVPSNAVGVKEKNFIIFFPFPSSTKIKAVLIYVL